MSQRSPVTDHPFTWNEIQTICRQRDLQVTEESPPQLPRSRHKPPAPTFARTAVVITRSHWRCSWARRRHRIACHICKSTRTLPALLSTPSRALSRALSHSCTCFVPRNGTGRKRHPCPSPTPGPHPPLPHAPAQPPFPNRKEGHKQPRRRQMRTSRHARRGHDAVPPQQGTRILRLEQHKTAKPAVHASRTHPRRCDSRLSHVGTLRIADSTACIIRPSPALSMSASLRGNFPEDKSDQGAAPEAGWSLVQRLESRGDRDGLGGEHLLRAGRQQHDLNLGAPGDTDDGEGRRRLGFQGVE